MCLARLETTSRPLPPPAATFFYALLSVSAAFFWYIYNICDGKSDCQLDWFEKLLEDCKTHPWACMRLSREDLLRREGTANASLLLGCPSQPPSITPPTTMADTQTNSSSLVSASHFLTASKANGKLVSAVGLLPSRVVAMTT